MTTTTTDARAWDALTATERWGYVDRARQAQPTADAAHLEARAAHAYAQDVANGAVAQARIEAEAEQSTFYRDLAARIRR
jgi:hypothetical protein